MKTIPVSFLVAGILLPTLCLAQPPEPPKAPPGREKSERGESLRPFLEAWKLADSDHDGFISKAEFEAMPRTKNLPAEKRENLFKRLDKDADGKLSREELGHFKAHDGPGPQMQRLWELDTDKSGGISFQEFKAGQLFMKLPPERQEAVFRRLDSNDDGMITPQDHPQPPFRHPEGMARPEGAEDKHHENEGAVDESGHINHKLDLNGDGALSFEEFRVSPAMKNLTEDEQEDRFQLLDRNGDLKISAEDLAPPRDKSAGH